MSERKWVVEKGESFDDRSSAQYVTHSGSIDAGDDHFNIRQRVTDDAGGYAKARTRLRLIVTAVNNHAALVAQLERIVNGDPLAHIDEARALLARIAKA